MRFFLSALLFVISAEGMNRPQYKVINHSDLQGQRVYIIGEIPTPVFHKSEARMVMEKLCLCSLGNSGNTCWLYENRLQKIIPLPEKKRKKRR